MKINVSWERIKENLSIHKYPYILLGVILMISLPMFRDLIFDWYHDDNYSHGFLIIPISIYLFYESRNQLSFPAKTSKLGMFAFIGGFLLLLIGTAAGEYFTSRVALVLIISGLACHHLGLDNFRKVWFPFFFLLFMIPIPATIYFALTSPLQQFAAQVTDTLLNLIGVPSARHGNIIILPNYRLEVAEACSGLRSLVTLLALGALYANTRLSGKVIPIILFILIFPIAVVTNIFRIFVTAIGAHAISTELADGFLHEVSGMLVFLLALFLIIILGAILQWIRKRFI